MNRQRLRRLGMAMEAAAWLLTAWLALRLVPFRHVAGAFRPRVGNPLPRGPERERVLAQVCRIVRRVARSSPIPMVCFPRAIAAQRMLARRGVPTSLSYGVRRDPAGHLSAHVWVNVDQVIVLGGPAAGFAIVAVFDSTSLD